MHRIMHAHLALLRAEEDCHDVSFARITLLVMGAVFMGYGLVNTAYPGIIFGAVALLASLYFSSHVIPEKRNEAEQLRKAFYQELQ